MHIRYIIHRAYIYIFLFLFKGEDVEVKQQCIEASSVTHMVGANQLPECRACKRINVVSFAPF